MKLLKVYHWNRANAEILKLDSIVLLLEHLTGNVDDARKKKKYLIKSVGLPVFPKRLKLLLYQPTIISPTCGMKHIIEGRSYKDLNSRSLAMTE